MNGWMKRGIVLGVVVFLSTGASSAWGQTSFPDRPIQVVIPFGAGGGSDAVRVFPVNPSNAET